MTSKFAILATARSGSNLLSSRLSSHPDIFVHGEIFHSKHIAGPLHHDGSIAIDDLSSNEMMTLRERAPLKFLNTILAGPERNCVGFKLFLNHNETVLNYVIEDSSYKLLVLERANRLAAYSSAAIGSEVGVWHTTKQPSTKAIEFDRTRFLATKKFLDESYAALRSKLSGRPGVVWLEYRQLNAVDSDDAALELLGVDRAYALSSPLVKQNPEQPIARFTNRDAVEAALAEIGHSEWAIGG